MIEFINVTSVIVGSKLGGGKMKYDNSLSQLRLNYGGDGEEMEPCQNSSSGFFYLELMRKSGKLKYLLRTAMKLHCLTHTRCGQAQHLLQPSHIHI